MRRWVAPAAALALVLFLCPGGWAGSPTEDLRGFFAAAARILDDPAAEDKPEARLSAIHAIVGDIFDFREASRLSLGPDWAALRSEEQDEFVRLFADLLKRSFIVAVASRIRLADGVQVSYLGESVDGAAATVHTTIVSRSGLDLPFDYRMIDRSDRWAVRDVVIDGVSLAANYRAQFTRVIQASSYPALVRQIEAKTLGAPSSTLVTTVGADSRATARVTPAPSLTNMTGKESTEAPRQAVAETQPDLHDLATGGRSSERLQSAAVPLPRAEVEPAAIRPKRAAEDGGARTEPRPAAVAVARADPEPAAIRPKRTAEDGARKTEPHAAAPRRERVAPPDQLQEVTAARPLTAPVPSVRSYWVQVGAFKNPEAARRLLSLLREQKPAASSRWVVAVEAGPAAAALARVRIGPFLDRAAAASALRELQARGYKPFIAEQRD